MAASDRLRQQVADARDDVVQDRWRLESFIDSLPLGEFIAKHLIPPQGKTPFQFALDAENGLSESLKDRLDAASLGGLYVPIQEAITKLKKEYIQVSQLSSKFLNDDQPALELAPADTARFHRGLESVIGEPKLRDGSVIKQLEHEHCTSEDSLTPFVTRHPKGQAIPHTQWLYVCSAPPRQPNLSLLAQRSPRAACFCPPQVVDPRKASDDGTFHLRSLGRNHEPLSAYEEKMEAINERLAQEGHTPLRREELIGVRL